VCGEVIYTPKYQNGASRSSYDQTLLVQGMGALIGSLCKAFVNPIFSS
jgi:hypothetical protein